MHINQRLVQCLESTMDHSLPQVELWSIWKKSCNQSIWAQNYTNSVWLGIFWIIQNPWRIRRRCNYKSCFKLHLLYPQFSGNFSHPLAIFPGIIWFRQLFSCQWRWGRRRTHLSAPSSHLAATHHVITLCARVKMVTDAGPSRSHVALGRWVIDPLSCALVTATHSLLPPQVVAAQASRRVSSGTTTTGEPSRCWLPRVFVWCRRLIHELHHDAPVPSSLTTGATCRSYGLAPMNPSVELPPPSRAPLWWASPPSLTHLTDGRRRNPADHRHPAPATNCRSPAPWWAVSPGRRPPWSLAVGQASCKWATPGVA
jgi:hypothetical protein